MRLLFIASNMPSSPSQTVVDSVQDSKDNNNAEPSQLPKTAEDWDLYTAEVLKNRKKGMKSYIKTINRLVSACLSRIDMKYIRLTFGH